MPVYEYRCKDCGGQYEVFHIGREIVDDVVCPACQSKSHTRLMSVSNVGAISSGPAHSHHAAPPACAGGCCGGACDLD